MVFWAQKVSGAFEKGAQVYSEWSVLRADWRGKMARHGFTRRMFSHSLGACHHHHLTITITSTTTIIFIIVVIIVIVIIISPCCAMGFR